MTDEDIYVARERLRKVDVKIESEGPDFFKWDLWKRILSDWKCYVFSIFNIFAYNASNGTSGAYLLWLKSLNKYSIPKVNQYSAITPALGIVWIFLTGVVADNFRSRFGAVMFSQSFNMLGNILLAVWNIPEGAIWFAFCLQYFGWAVSPAMYSWAADVTRHNPQERAIITITMNMIGQATAAWTSILVWKTVEAPRYLKGFSFTAANAFCLMAWAAVILALYKKEEKKYAAENRILIYNSANGELPPTIPEDDPKNKEKVEDIWESTKEIASNRS